MDDKIKLGKYQHYKGSFHEVIGMARHSETLSEMVVYKHLGDDKEFGKDALWVRPKEMFFGMVIIDGKEVERFKYIGESS